MTWNRGQVSGDPIPRDPWPSVADPHSHWNSLSGFPGPTWHADGNVWIVHEPSQLLEVASDWRTYSNAVPNERDVRWDFLLTVDPPTHTSDRAQFMRCFGPSLEATTESVVSLVEQSVAQLRFGMDVDLIEQLCRPIGYKIVARTIGHPGSLDDSAIPVDDLGDFAPQFVEDVRKNRSVRESPLLRLNQELMSADPATADGKTVGLAAALLIAMADTLPAALGLALFGLARAPANRSSPPAVFDDTPLLGLYRVATRDTLLAGRQLRSGDRLFLAWSAGNFVGYCSAARRDFSFGLGRHRCPAQDLVNKLVNELVHTFMEGFHVQLQGDWQPAFADHPHLRRLLSLPVRLDRV